jgi:hypothetical protein
MDNPQPPEDSYKARPSARVANQTVQADHDTWQEMLAVVEDSTGKLIIRSYYQSANTRSRNWDEPPSGATNIKPATEEMRKMANLQLNEIHVVTGAAEDKPSPQAAATSSKKKGWNPLRRKSKADKGKQTAAGASPKTKLQYKSGSKFKSNSKHSSGSYSGETQDTADAQLQKAIARSIAEATGKGGGGEEYKSAVNDVEDDEELAMAKALSMSEAESTSQHHSADGAGISKPAMTEEDEMFRRALEESKREAGIAQVKGGAREHALSGDLLGLDQDFSKAQIADDRKLPAKQQPAPAFLKSPPSYATAPAVQSPPSAASPTAAGLAYPNSPTPYAATAAAAAIPPQSPGARFDPYSQHNLAAATVENQKKAPPPQEATGVPLQKMDEHEQSQKSRHTFGARRGGSTKKIQDKAGLV